MALAPAVIEIKDPLTLSVYNTHDVLVDKNDEGIITSLEIPNLATIELGRKITTKPPKHTYKVNSIVSRVGGGSPIYDLKIASRTKASMYILPMFPGPKQAYFYNQFLMNCFVGTQEHDNVIALLYRFSGLRQYVEFEGALEKLSYFRERKDIGPTTLYIFDIPPRWKNDYHLFKAGKYSKMSDAYKKRILEFHQLDKNNVYGQILYKAEARKKFVEEMIDDVLPDDAELQSVPDLNTEVFDPEVYAL